MSETDDTDLLAAEYVLGTLDGGERAAVAARLPADAGLAHAVRAWEDRLAPLVAGVPEVSPPLDAYAGIASRLFGDAAVAGQDGTVVALRAGLRRWRAATAGFALMAASLMAWVAVREVAWPRPDQRFTAVLQRDAGAPAVLVDVDLASRRLSVRQLGAAAPDGRAYQLWIIAPALGAPRSLGLLRGGGDLPDALKPYDAASITAATYAVTVEAPGGSPTGLPTTPPVLTGRLLPFPS